MELIKTKFKGLVIYKKNTYNLYQYTKRVSIYIISPSIMITHAIAFFYGIYAHIRLNVLFSISYLS